MVYADHGVCSEETKWIVSTYAHTHTHTLLASRGHAAFETNSKNKSTQKKISGSTFALSIGYEYLVCDVRQLNWTFLITFFFFFWLVLLPCAFIHISAPPRPKSFSARFFSFRLLSFFDIVSRSIYLHRALANIICFCSAAGQLHALTLSYHCISIGSKNHRTLWK